MTRIPDTDRKTRRRKCLICPDTLKRADGFIRRAYKERRFTVRRGKRIDALAAVYNLMILGECSTYDGFLQWHKQALAQP